jgi:hypothetical protein
MPEREEPAGTLTGLQGGTFSISQPATESRDFAAVYGNERITVGPRSTLDVKPGNPEEF